LIRRLATRIWNVEDGRVETYPGTLDEYMYSMAQRRLALTEPAKTATPQQAPSTKDDDKARKRREAEARQKKSAKLGPLEKQVAQRDARGRAKGPLGRARRPDGVCRRAAPQQAARRLRRRARQARGADGTVGESGRRARDRARRARLAG